jgi:hypothetical protein
MEMEGWKKRKNLFLLRGKKTESGGTNNFTINNRKWN